MKKILLPTDMSELSEFAYNLAFKVAVNFGASIDLLHLIPSPQGAFVGNDGALMEDGNDYSSLECKKKNAWMELNEWASRRLGISHIEVQFGEVESGIVQYADKHNIDLIVMGTDGVHSFNAWSKGSHTGHILNHSNTPILSLKCNRVDLDIKNILLVSDFEYSDAKSLQIIHDFQEFLGVSLHLLKVNNSNNPEIVQQSIAQMNHCVQVNNLKNAHIHTVCDSSVEKGIQKFIAENEMDMIAIGTNQRSGLSKLFKHSISENVLHSVYHPILTFPIKN